MNDMSAPPIRTGPPVCLVPAGDTCGEGILWNEATQSIYWADINRFVVHRYSISEQTHRTWLFSEPVTCILATSRQETLALVLGSGVCLWNPAGDDQHAFLFKLPGWPDVRCNDAAVDPHGALWIGSMRNDVAADGAPIEVAGSDGILYRIAGNGEFMARRRDIGISNTLAWSPDARRFYFADTLLNRIWSYDYNHSDICLESEQPFFQDFPRGLPDGSAMDAEGYLWNCRYDGNCVVRIAPSGEVNHIVELPVSNPTNCTFGGPNRQTLYITSASSGSEKWERFGGALFAVETNVQGLVENAFELPSS